MKHSLKIWTAITLLLLTGNVRGQSDLLPRQARWGAAISYSGDKRGAIVRQVALDSAAERGGLKAGDLIVKINGREIIHQQAYLDAYRLVKGGDTAALRVSREGRMLDLKITPPPLPEEVIPGVEVRYESVTTERGYRLRTIITKPANAKGRLPAILLVQWLSCDQIESPLGLTDGVSKVLRGLAEKSGFVLMRVEKPGLGDSEGPDCSQNDLQTDMTAYRAALRQLKKYDFVDQNNVFLFGVSLGGALVPVLAEGEPLRGLIVTGGFTKTWFEHMMEIERTRLGLMGKTATEINQSMRGYGEFYSLYLNRKLNPAEVISQRPDLAKLWYDEPEHQYGRPASFFHQAQELNVEAAWENVSSRVLILYGEYDWIMSRADHQLAADIVNRRHPGMARLVVLPGTDHNLDVYESPLKAFQGEGGRFDEGVLNLMIEWLKSNTGSAAR